jgi:23S rRNA pseudouridine2605 synthase
LNVRLNKLLSNRGVAARRKCDALIAGGAVTVNGKLVTAPGTHVDPDHDDVRVNGKRLQGVSVTRYFVLNKPVGMISTLSDPEGRRSLRDVMPPGARVFPVGRLDADTSGLLLLTNDGDLAHHLMHPRYGVEKFYRVVLEEPPVAQQLERLARGVNFEPGVRSAPARVRERDSVSRGSVIEIAIAEGRYRQVRRMCEAVGLGVVALHRWGYGPLRLGDLARGMWRELSEEEVRLLKAASSRPKARPASLKRPQGRRRGMAPVDAGTQRIPDARGDDDVETTWPGLPGDEGLGRDFFADDERPARAERGAARRSRPDTAAPGRDAGARPARGGSARPRRDDAARPARGPTARPRRDDAARPARGSSARPRRDDAARPARGSSARPRRDDAARPARGKSARPRRDDAARPARGSSARPRRDDAARPARGSSARPRRDDAARPARGSSARPRRDDAARPARGGSARPPRDVAARPARGSATRPRRSTRGDAAPEFESFKRRAPRWEGMQPEARTRGRADSMRSGRGDARGPGARPARGGAPRTGRPAPRPGGRGRPGVSREDERRFGTLPREQSRSRGGPARGRSGAGRFSGGTASPSRDGGRAGSGAPGRQGSASRPQRKGPARPAGGRTGRAGKPRRRG